MIARLQAWFLTHLTALIIGACCGAFVGVSLYDGLPFIGAKARIAKVNGKLAAANQNLAQCRLNGVTLNNALDAQSLAVRSWKAEADRKAKASERAIREARREGDDLRRRADRALAARPGQDACKSADRLILESLSGVR